ncbi:MAG TPA: D-alanyl-D-alanine carboxypeptidase family protein [Bacilli bacterium]|nr:D-alanyl-D-alanine carboxypeptidase family protein [Bacilli bacterium]
MRKRRFLKTSAAGALALTLLFGTQLPVPSAWHNLVQQPVAHAEGTDAKQADLNLQAAAGLLMDVKTGQILWQKNMDAKRYPASVTKIMTMLLIYDAVDKGEKTWDDIVPVSKNAYGTEGSSVWLDPSEKWTLREMLEFIAIPSANDACVATSEFIAGSEEAFVARMNKKAQELGMTGTHFADTNGLHHPDHYTTAHDIALMARELLTKHPEILEITKIQSKMIRNNTFKLENTNHVLGHYEGLDGLKTGFTDEAGYNLAGTAERDGFRILSIELGAPNDAARVDDTIRILDYGFTNFTEQTVATKGEAAPEKATIPNGKEEEIDAVLDQDLIVALKNDQKGELTKKVTFDEVEAPVKKGQKLGKLEVMQDGKVIATGNLVAKQDVEEGSWIRLMFRGIGHFFGNLFSAIGDGIAGLFD